MQRWIDKTNPNASSLENLYKEHRLRENSYRAITDYILETLTKNNHVCVVIYGHPTVFAEPGLNAVIEAKKKGYEARILPGISAIDCLFADLLIDPGSVGCQIFEATDFLIHKRKFDNTSHLILWQIDVIGILDNPLRPDSSRGLKYLVNYLKSDYKLNHKVIMYQASQYPYFKSQIETIYLKDLPENKITPISTLYIPPAKPSFYDEDVIKDLKMNLNDLKVSSN
jgi:uncharacterized protein YabN with tetrapyrrole methylase and pyrophosphatase domain